MPAKIIAHRGANKIAPENTMPAFALAKEMGANGFENDVHMTADGVIVVCHDDTIDKTSDGSGLINGMTLSQLHQYDFGSYFSTDFAGTKIPTLREFYALAKGLEVINVEIKRPANGDYAIVGGVIAMAKETGVFNELLISSFDEDVLEKAFEIEPECKTALLYSPAVTNIDKIAADPVAYAKGLYADAIHPMYLMVDGELVKNAHENGLEVNPWVINHPDAIAMLIEMGCDGIITDVPDVALSLLNAGVKG